MIERIAAYILTACIILIVIFTNMPQSPERNYCYFCGRRAEYHVLVEVEVDVKRQWHKEIKKWCRICQK